jgi:hypothetical protein
MPASPPSNIYCELVVSTWPFRTGVLVYEPLAQVELIRFKIGDFHADWESFQAYSSLLNPAIDYSYRANGLLQLLGEDREGLEEMLGFPLQDNLHLKLSDDVVREVEACLDPFGYGWADVQLSSLEGMVENLIQTGSCQAVAAAWWDRFERPSAWSPPDPDLWQTRFQLPVDEWSLSDYLRGLAEWEAYFPQQPLPECQAWKQLDQWFGMQTQQTPVDSPPAS